MNRTRVVSILIACVGASVSGILIAGPLSPPSGPVASSYKTLSEVEPRTAVQSLPGSATAVRVISQPGSYYLTGNIQATYGKAGIVIDSNAVTLDLNGFTIFGEAGSKEGVYSLASNVTVRNGSIQSCSGGGIGMQPSGPQLIENVRVSSCGVTGIAVGLRSRVVDCFVQICPVGITVGDTCELERCAVYSSSTGIAVGGSCKLSACLSNGNYGDGFYETGSGNTYTDCTSSNNGGRGFNALNFPVFTNCQAIANAGAGFAAVREMMATHCSANQGGSHGFQIGENSTVQGCTALQNAGDGILAFLGNRIRACTVARCGGTSAGIHLTQPANVVEDCSVMYCSRGMFAEAVGSKFMRNTCSANATNWQLTGGNFAYVVVGPSAPGFSGNLGGLASGATDPQANYSY